MNTEELSNRVCSSGRNVVSTFETFKGQYQALKNDMANKQNSQQINELDENWQLLNSSINGLKRSMEIFYDPRFNRRR